MNEIIEQSVILRASAPEIWRALTDRDDLEEWWSEGVTLEPKVGGKFIEIWEDDEGKPQLATGEVLLAKPNKEIKFTWNEKNWSKDAFTECSIIIVDNKSVRTLTLKHSGWEIFPEAKRKKLLKDFEVGWKYHLEELKSFLDDGP
jgi:uncharacterized protein YndB with AHSA1/START domain